ncbi:hypothetical protein ACH5RR_021358 [Cinchona calisaya]|uniref:Bifunctional inhibitor/plant lipid transfer protein/seed storage helical domain-containing protein n=1 Tax=Cinchona calisaya TaxID=153742 RepID=A0ABD2ZI11_9GENT
MAKTPKTPTISATLTVAAVIILVALFPTGTNAQSAPAAAPGPSSVAAAPGPFSGAPAPALDCFPYLLNLSDCLTYVEVGSNLTKPDKGCCPELATLVTVKPICLCELLGNPNQSPVPIDITKALGLPALCKVHTPPVSLCSALGVPVGAPVPASAGGPTGALSPEGSASNSTSPDNGNDGQSITASQRHVLVGLSIVLFISFF